MSEKNGLVDLAKVTPVAFRENLARCPAVTMAVGSIEWHNAHLPLGLDTLKADALCRRIADEVGCFAAPPLFYGYPYHFCQQGLMPTMSCDIDALQQYLVSIFKSFHAIGFKVVFVISGHYENLQLLVVRAAAQIAMDDCPKLSVIAHMEPELTFLEGCDGDHAGPYETSLALAMFPELVRMQADAKEAVWTAPEEVQEHTADGGKGPNWQHWAEYYEDTRRNSSAEYGEKVAKVIVDKAAEVIRFALENPGWNPPRAWCFTQSDWARLHELVKDGET